MSTQVKLMTIGDVCRYTQKSREKIELYLRCPEKAPVPFPPPVHVEGKERLWDRKEVKRWAACYKQYRSIVNLRVRGNTRVLQVLKAESQNSRSRVEEPV